MGRRNQRLLSGDMDGLGRDGDPIPQLPHKAIDVSEVFIDRGE
jgi:hypothetical protein